MKWLLRIQSLIFSEINPVAGFLLLSPGRRQGITCDSPQELSESVGHFSRYIRRVPSRGRGHRAMSAFGSQFCALSATSAVTATALITSRRRLISVSGLCRSRPRGPDFDADGLRAGLRRGFGDGCCLPSDGDLRIERQVSTHTGCSRDGGTVAARLRRPRNGLW